MFSIEKFSEEAYEGNQVNIREFSDYIKSYENVVLWGAGNLGAAIGKKFIELGIEITTYWDARYNEVKSLHSIHVIETFTGGFDLEKTIVVFCIGNVPVGPSLLHLLMSKGWKNVIHGNAILQGILCPFTKDNEFDAGVCNNWDICSVCACERLTNIVKSKTKKNNVFALDRVHFIINNYCNLKCTHCNRYMNSYPNEKKINLDTEIIKEDIRRVMGAIDAVGVVILFGGEPFLHPDMDKIVESIVAQDNFGSLLINTNGIFNMKESQWRGLDNGRIRVAFSNYISAITDTQQEQFYKNLKNMQIAGICAKAQNEVPTWFEPTTLCNNNVSEEKMCLNRSACDFPYLFVYDHKVFPCTMALTLYDLGISDYATDYVDINKTSSDEELKEKIVEMMERKFFFSCGHCDDTGGIVNAAGEQGFSARYALPTSDRYKGEC